MAELHLVWRQNWSNVIFGGPEFELEVQEAKPQTLAEVGFQIVAATLGEVLRKAYRDHLVACPECSARPNWCFSCTEGERLFYLQPAGDTIAIA